MRKSMPSNQMKALTMAMAGATVAAVATMFVPASMLEGLTGATGLSEMIPPAAAPLGDTARALIAFAAGAFTLAILAYFLLRQETAPTGNEPQEASSIKDILFRIPLPAMPWSKSEEDITELSDLPKLRMGDSHPDAPPRRPLVASEDLPVLALNEDEQAAAAEPETGTEVAIADEEVAADAAASDEPADDVAPPSASSEPADVQPTLAEMVAQLEAAVAERQQQLLELEAVAAKLGARNEEAKSSEQALVEDPAPLIRTGRLPLEAVPASPGDDAIDSALEAALATLHRMNGTSR